jgi:NAD-dependent deacetylase
LDAFRQAPRLASLPRCPACGAILRQHVLWFDEYYDEHESYQWPRVLDAAARMDVVVFVGTSFAVGVTDLFLHAALDRATPALSIDPAADGAPHPRITHVADKAELILPAACARLRRCAR